MKYIIGSSVILVFLLLGAYLFSLSAEITTSRLDSKEDVKEWIDRGWGPGWFPEDSYNILESHDIDNNSVWVAANFSQNSIANSPSCISISRDELRLPNENYFRRLPVAIQERFTALTSEPSTVHYAKCGGGFFAAVNESGKAMIWSFGDQ